MDIHSNDQLDENVVSAMRSLYAAPGDVTYWDLLEAQIVAGIGLEAVPSRDNGWFSVLARWAAPGLAAAALLFAVAGALWSRLDEAELRTTYEGFTQPMIVDAMPGAMGLLDLPRDANAQREATLMYLFSH